MDILHLVDRLEELFNESRPFPFTKFVIVDEDRMLDIIDQMRVAVPDEMKKAQKLLSDRDKIMAQAQEEANRTVQIARDKSDGLVERDSIVETAQMKVVDIIQQAQYDAEVTRKEADQYVMESLRNLEVEAERVITQIRNGIRTLQEDNYDEVYQQPLD